MEFVLTCAAIIFIVALILTFLKFSNIVSSIIGVLFFIALGAIVVGVDYRSQTDATEVWSGKITNIEHKEEWDEWHPPRTETYTTTDSKGRSTTHTRVIPGYTEHHDAENYVKTSDGGQRHVLYTPDGTWFTDSFVNSDAELGQYFPINQPTASTHTYENKIQASYSIYKHKDIDVSEFKNLPEYPSNVNGHLQIERFIGDIPNKEEVVESINDTNTKLNEGDNPKQVNLIFVNLGDVTEDSGFALQDLWKGGNKNDFIIIFGEEDGKVTWCQPFSWSEVEILKSDIRDYMLDKSNLEDFKPTVTDVSKMIEDKFERKQFADFSYINIEIGMFAKVIIIILSIIMLFLIIVFGI